MNISIAGIVEIASYEGLSVKPYLDSGGVKTVGIGSTISDIIDINSWAWDKESSIDALVYIYINSLQRYGAAVNNNLRVEVTQNQFDALVSITYNIGYGAGGLATSTFLKRLNNGESPDRVVEAMSWFCKDNGKYVQGLANRRAKEAGVFLHGHYLSGGRIPWIDVNPVTYEPSYGKTINILPWIEKVVGTEVETPVNDTGWRSILNKAWSVLTKDRKL